MGQDGGSGLDITSVSHALGSILQELQIPVRSDQGHLSGDSQPIKCASHSISAVLNPHPSSLSSKPDPEVFFLVHIPGLPGTRRCFCPEVGDAWP